MPVYGLANYGAIDAGLGDGGLTLVSEVGVDRLENWASLSKDQEKSRREAWLDALQADIDRAYPGFGSAVKTRTFLNARSMQGFLGTPSILDINQQDVPAEDPALRVPQRQAADVERSVHAIVTPDTVLDVVGFSGRDRMTPARHYAWEILLSYRSDKGPIL